jgi:shikimate dehydrogenase
MIREYGLIGYPLSHSFSQKYFNEKFHRDGIDDAVFHAFPIPNDRLLTAFDRRASAVKGFCYHYSLQKRSDAISRR